MGGFAYGPGRGGWGGAGGAGRGKGGLISTFACFDYCCRSLILRGGGGGGGAGRTCGSSGLY